MLEIGQDESHICQNEASTKMWMVEGIRSPLSKSSGVTRMASCLVDDHERGFGLRMSSAELAVVNAARVGKLYKHNGELMQPLTESPGASATGR